MKTEDQKKAEATERQRQRDERTVNEQLAILDERLGKGKGAEKERERLLKEKMK